MKNYENIIMKVDFSQEEHNFIQLIHFISSINWSIKPIYNLSALLLLTLLIMELSDYSVFVGFLSIPNITSSFDVEHSHLQDHEWKGQLWSVPMEVLGILE